MLPSSSIFRNWGRQAMRPLPAWSIHSRTTRQPFPSAHYLSTLVWATTERPTPHFVAGDLGVHCCEALGVLWLHLHTYVLNVASSHSGLRCLTRWY